MRYYFSGLDPRYGTVFENLPSSAGLMFSASTFSRPAFLDLFLSCRRKHLPMVLDSGVVQGWIGEDEYIELFNEVGGCFEWCAHYDRIHDFYGSNGNFNYEREYITGPLSQKLLYVLQSTPMEGFTDKHYRAVMQVLLHATPHIGIGGLADFCRRGELGHVCRYLDTIASRLGPQVCQWIHLFGIGNHQLLRRYRSVFGSADSSTWLCGAHGELLQPDGTRRRILKPFDKLSVLRHNVEMMLEWADDGMPAPKLPPYQIVPVADPYLLYASPT